MNISRISGYTPQTFIQQYGSVGLKKNADVGTLADASQTMSRILQLEAETKRGDDDRWDEFDGIPGKVKIEAPYSSALGCGKEFSELDYDPKSGQTVRFESTILQDGLRQEFLHTVSGGQETFTRIVLNGNDYDSLSCQKTEILYDSVNGTLTMFQD